MRSNLGFLSRIKNFINGSKTESVDPRFELLMEAAITKFDNGRLKSGRDEMLKALFEYQKPLDKVWAAYNLGAIFWGQIGNGMKAREYYTMAVNESEIYGIKKIDQEFPTLVANACENLIHLSLSYEECFKWSDKQRILQPTDNVFKRLVPWFKEMQGKGHPWSLILENIAGWSYNKNDQKKDRGEYARAVSTYHLILYNRKDLRINRDVWGRIIYEYGTLVMRVATDAMGKMVHSHQSEVADEFIFVVQDSIPFVEEYLSANPSNTEVQNLFEKMNGYIHHFKKLEKENRVAILNNEGLKLHQNKDLNAAFNSFKESIILSRSIGDPKTLQSSLGNMALVAFDQGKKILALELISEKETICRQNNFRDNLIKALAMKANVLDSLNKLIDALNCAEEANQLCLQYGFNEYSFQIRTILAQIKLKIKKNK